MIQYLATLFAFCLFANSQTNEIPFRYQWMENTGYCGEVSLISAGLFYGQYISQFEARAILTTDGSQINSSLLLGVNDKKAARKMHLEAESWDGEEEENTEQFLIWLKQKIAEGVPVAIGIYLNHYLYNGSTDPNAGDPDYDHIVSVVDLKSNHSLTDPTYYGDDQIGFCDNGLWQNGTTPIYYFNYTMDSFQRDRAGSNAKDAPVYSLANDGNNYGIAITGVKDLHGDTLPIRITTDYNFEKPEILEGSNRRPTPMPLTLTITISNLEPKTPYILYRYNQLNAVPDSAFNKQASQASQTWKIQIDSGSTYTFSQQIQSDETAAYRCVKAKAP